MTHETRIREWLDGPYDAETKAAIARLTPEERIDAFFRDLAFGTGGMRGIMGVGTNRMNVYTVRRAAQGLANYLKEGSVFIGYDMRHNSRLFAEECARVLAGNGIRPLLTHTVCPTPFVSFGCRYYDCQAAIMITASHNPPQYNGLKIYWRGGAQVVPPHDAGIMREVARVHAIHRFDGALSEVGEALEKEYLKEIESRKIAGPTDLSIVYTNLHGTGICLLPQALTRWGFASPILVESQAPLDPNFSMAASPNPEESRALQDGLQVLRQHGADLLLATDPDADRLGAAIDGHIFTGNQIACLCLDHLCQCIPLPSNGACIKTIVTTELFSKIAQHYGLACIDVLTGFKYIAEKIAEWEASFGGYQFLFGAEESHGYLFDTFVRDKDAILAACLLASAAAHAKSQGYTLHDRLLQLYQRHGTHRERLLNFTLSEAHIMQRLRSSPPLILAGVSAASMTDYLQDTPLPRSDVLALRLIDDTKITLRPSGTEPKLKVYIEVVGQECEARLDRFEHALRELLTSPS